MGYIKNGQSIVDVRTIEEFTMGHVLGSINIPLQELEWRVEELKALSQPIILCCASGNRSGVATVFLKNCGIECENGGSWIDVQFNFQTA